MKKTKILAMLLCIVMILSGLFLPACDSDPDAGKTPSDDGTDQNPPTDPDKEDTSMESENKLYKKTMIWNGDSICYGSSVWGSWADRVAEKNGINKWKNFGVNGGTITENVLYASTGKVRHSVCASLEQMHLEYPDADYIIIEGGTNDAGLLGDITEGNIPPRFGSFSADDFSGNYNRETFCGALESIFYRAKQLWPDKTVCYIVAQKMGTHTATVENRYAYFEVAMQICEKWEIPYLNLWDNCDLDPHIPEMYDPNKTAEENAEVSMYTDGQHLTPAGYDYTSDIINAWLKTL